MKIWTNQCLLDILLVALQLLHKHCSPRLGLYDGQTIFYSYALQLADKLISVRMLKSMALLFV